MKQSYFSSEHAPFEVDIQLSSRLGHYGIQPKYDDADRLRAYLVIRSLEDKANDKSGWLLGFLICASIWSLTDNGWPFSFISEIYVYFEWPRNAIVFCNLLLLTAFWIALFIFVTGYQEKQFHPWQVSDEELSDLVKWIHSMRHLQERSSS